MKVNSTHSSAALAALAFLALFSFGACTAKDCIDPVGRWSTREGQSIVFQKKGKALWLTRFGSKIDTTPMAFRYDCGSEPATLDFFGFRAGSLVGKTLFGIVEWNSDTTFRYNADAGTNPYIRPTTFESEQTMKFFLERNSQPTTE
ncbi:MAG: hypothetical protein ACKVU2_11490 [Saprospiraceae bacterium]